MHLFRWHLHCIRYCKETRDNRDQHVRTVVFKMDRQQGPTVERRECCSVLRGTWMGGGFGGEWIHVDV